MTMGMRRSANIFFLSLILGFFSACGESKTGTSGGGYKPTDLNGSAVVTPIYVYSGGQRTGNLGGRAGADQFCESALPTDLNGMEVHALISVNANDEIADMVTNYDLPTDKPFVGYGSETVIAESWTDLLDGTLDVSLEAAGILGMANTFWSGSNANGTLAVIHCNEWSSAGGGVFGAAGASTVIDSTWTYSISAGCSALRDVICVAY
jgi:hypothetical protein